MFGLLMFSIACEGGKMSEKNISLNPISNIPESTWKKLSEKTIYFGHQSVGLNIIDGLKDIMKENPRIKLKLVETNDPNMFTNPLFAHSGVGKNGNPDSKVDAFGEFIENGIGNRANFAFLKFCFVDITADTDVHKVFAHYKDSMKHLKDKYLETTFIHVTVPLTSIQTGPKAWVKKIIGRPIDGYADNIKRNQFNELLRKEYEGKEPIFDLARIESFSLNGKPASFVSDGKTYYAMNPEFTHDGGHLNENSRKIVAQHLLILLANLVK